MGDSFIEIEHRPGGEVVVRFKSPDVARIMSEGTVDHFRTAQKELVLGLRDLLENAVQYARPTRKAPPRKRSKIDIQ